MKPYSNEIRDLYLNSSNVWNWRADTSEHPKVFDDIRAAWRKYYSEEMPPLLEPYDLKGEDLLYVFPQERFLFIARMNGKFSGAEIREYRDLFWVADALDESVIFFDKYCIFARTPPEAIAKASLLVSENGIDKPWILFRLDWKTKQTEIVYRSLK